MDNPNQKKSLLIGIDPDTEASGWAAVNLNDRTIHLETMPFLIVLDRLNFFETIEVRRSAPTALSSRTSGVPHTTGTHQQEITIEL